MAAIGGSDSSADASIQNTAQQESSNNQDGSDMSRKRKNNSKRGGVKKRLSILAYQQQMRMMRGGHPGGRPLYPPPTNHGQPAMPMRFPVMPGPRPLPPQKFGFFNEAAPSVHPGHPGSEKRTYEGPPKPRFMMEELARIPGPRTVPKPPLMFNPPRPTVKVEDVPNVESPENNSSVGAGEQQTGINELFARMVWKKLDMIKSQTRLNRLHTEIMNLLQQAIAEEASGR